MTPERCRTYVGAMVALTAIAVLPVMDARAQVSGVVVEAASGAPLADAIVSVQASEIETRTASDGSFALDAATGSGLVIAGAAFGFFTGSVAADAGASDLRIELERVPTEEDPSYPFASPISCSHCHSAQYSEWSESAMAHAGRNTWVADLYAGNGTPGGEGGFVYTRDSVHAGSNAESECASCHQPVVWAKVPFVALAPPSSEDFDVDEGVSCDICHKIAEVDETRMSFPGIHPDAVRLTRPGPEWTVQYGLLADVDFVQSAEMRASYQPQLAAAVCGTCHEDRNDPDGDGDFEDEDGAVSEPTYGEWLRSPYADPSSEHYATCIDCHMEPTEDTMACSMLETELSRPRGDVRSHRFPGTTPRMLQSALALEMSARLEDDRVAVDVTVTNDGAGHHVPTGVTIRNVILLVEARRVSDGALLDALGEQRVHALGGEGDPAEGYYAGSPGKLYATINHGPDGEGPVFYTEATGIASDTRLAPLASDATSYAFRLPEGGGDVRITARLIYRRAWRAVVDAKGWTTDGHGQPLEDIAAPHYGHLMEQVEEVVPLAGGLPDAGIDAGPGESPSSSGCGCRAGQSRSGEAAIVLVTLLTSIARRRRGARRG